MPVVDGAGLVGKISRGVPRTSDRAAGHRPRVPHRGQGADRVGRRSRPARRAQPRRPSRMSSTTTTTTTVPDEVTTTTASPAVDPLAPVAEPTTTRATGRRSRAPRPRRSPSSARRARCRVRVPTSRWCCSLVGRRCGRVRRSQTAGGADDRSHLPASRSASSRPCGRRAAPVHPSSRSSCRPAT